MDALFLRALQAQIMACEVCAPWVHTSEMPKISGGEAAAKDAVVASIISAGRTRRCSRVLTELGVRRALDIVAAARLLRLLRDLAGAALLPAWLGDALSALGVAGHEQWAYLDALQCAHRWLIADGLDVGEPQVRRMLQIIGTGQPELAPAVATLLALGEEPDPVSGDQVSRALRGPWGDE